MRSPRSLLRPLGLLLIAALGGPPPASAAEGDCSALASFAPGKVPDDALQVVDLGAKPDDADDDTDAIQNALSEMKPGQTLVFAPGRYLLKGSLRITVPNTTLRGEGATLHGTNPDDLALFVSADGVSVLGFTLTARTEKRRSAPRHARIAVLGDTPSGPSHRPVYDTLIANVKIQAAGPDDPNSSSAAGIFLFRAQRFVIANNTVSRTLADGIHVTAGSRDGVIVGNTLRETGDDMIAVVSYMRPSGPKTKLPSGATSAARYDSLSDSYLVRNVLIANNDLSGNYWGRGMTVLGATDVTLRGNRLHDLPTSSSAGILIGREHNYLTFGVSNVLVEGNTLQRIHAAPPPYTPSGRVPNKNTPHGAIELHALAFADELEAGLGDELAVQQVLIRNNVVSGTRTSGVRTGAVNPGAVKGRAYVPGRVAGIGIVDNRFDDIGQRALNLTGTGTDQNTLYCSGNQENGKPVGGACKGKAPVVSGSRLACDSDGRIRR